jgi:ATP-binding cassette subfamily C (CFTR/MRP) protein 1
LLAISFLAAVAHLVLVLIKTPHRFKNVLALPSILHLISVPVLAALSWFNHYHSLRSSSIILLFWPVYLISLATTLRTQYSQLQHRESKSLYNHVYGDWDSTAKASLALFATSVGFGIFAWVIEVIGPEQGGIRLGEDVDYATSKPKSNGYQEVSGDNASDIIVEESGDESSMMNVKKMEDKIAMGHSDSPVLKANIYSRLTFGFLTRESLYLVRTSVQRKMSYADSAPLIV